jgi:hypothetical protein
VGICASRSATVSTVADGRADDALVKLGATFPLNLSGELIKDDVAELRMHLERQ